ncbi:hypothetical protein MKW94_029240 [Papaver nudicaule]|uniref:Uncharacterized protein n=1 Tax=Papaver nudicaule TaxID=74823 RepID=A0AA42B1H0_PAPNU|nr:hypothetical protein [Papaver nudicaule]
MTKTSFLVIGFFFVLLVVLQSVYVSGAGSPGDDGQCDPYMQLHVYASSCDKCEANCGLQTTSICLSESADEGAVCECCVQNKMKAHEEYTSVDTATGTTSHPYFSFSLFSSFMLNMLFNCWV